MSEKIEQTKYLRELRRGMLDGFNQEELKVIAFDLSVDWDDLPGDSITTKAQSLIMHMARRGRLEELVELLSEERPGVDWPHLPPSTQQVKDEQSITPNLLSDYLDSVSAFHDDYGAEADARIRILTDRLFEELREKGSKEQFTIALRYINETSRIRNTVNLNLSEIDLSNLRLPNASLRESNLSGTILSRADLSKADLSGAQMRGAYLHRADLNGANLNGADLSEANLHRANLSGAQLQRTDLGGTNLSEAIFDADTVWPIGFDPKEAGMVLVGGEGNPMDGS